MAYFPGGAATLVTDGSTGGSFDVNDPSFLTYGATAYLNGTGLATLEVVIKAVRGNTIMVRAKSLLDQSSGSDVSIYTTAASSTLTQFPQHVWDWRASLPSN